MSISALKIVKLTIRSIRTDHDCTVEEAEERLRKMDCYELLIHLSYAIQEATND